MKRIREGRRLTYREVTDRLAEMGRPMPPLALSRIEAGTRRVDVDDLVALAVALGVNASSLLLPHKATDRIEVTGAGTVDAHMAWAWADGCGPLPDPYDTDDFRLLDFVRYGRPSGYYGPTEEETRRRLGGILRNRGGEPAPDGTDG